MPLAAVSSVFIVVLIGTLVLFLSKRVKTARSARLKRTFIVDMASFQLRISSENRSTVFSTLFAALSTVSVICFRT